MKKALLSILIGAFVSTMVIAQSPALKFNGTDNVMDWAESTGALRDSENHTWEMWVKGPAATVGIIYTEGWGGSNYKGQFRVHADGEGKVKIEFRNALGTYLIPQGSTSTTTVFDEKWHHIAIVGSTTAGTTTTVLYVDGVADATDFGTYTRPTAWDATDGGALNNSVVGQISRAAQRMDNLANASNPYTWYNGEIDELRVWKRALSTEEIARNPCSPLITTNLHRHVRFNEGTGINFNDEVTSTTETLDGTTSAATYTTNSSCVYTSINESKFGDDFNVYPNPANNNLTFNSRVVAYKIYSLSGQLVEQAAVSSPSANISQLQKGVYLLQMSLNNGSTASEKLIKL